MNKNYYEILEVSQKASQEIIEKAYKVLIKKYHPDLQIDNLKSQYEKKIKLINEAYEILSDNEKRKNYDLNLKSESISLENYNKLYNENINLKKEINYLKNTSSSTTYIHNNKSDFNTQNISKDNTINSTNQNKIYNNYTNYENIRYNYKRIFKDLLALFLTVSLFILIGFILWHIPFSREFLISLYNQNEALKLIVDIFINIFK